MRLPIVSPEKLLLEIPDWLAKSQGINAACELVLIDDSITNDFNLEESIEVFFVKEKRIRKFSKKYSKLVNPAINESLDSF